MRVALANLAFPSNPEASVTAAGQAIEEAARRAAAVICFPECFVPGYRGMGQDVAPPSATFLEDAWARVASVAGRAGVAVILGTERLTASGLVATALVIDQGGAVLGFQDKVQIDPSEEATYTAGDGRQLFTTRGVAFGISICHEAWRYPETVRWAARRGAKIVFVPHFHQAEPASYRPTTFADPRNTFHEKALLCRAAENDCWIAAANYASAGSPTTSAIVRPDGTLLVHQPYGETGLLVADLDIAKASGLLAARWKPC